MFPFSSNSMTPTPPLLQPSLTGGGLAQPLITAPPIQPFMQTNTTIAAPTSLFPQLPAYTPTATTAGANGMAPNATSASTNPFLMMQCLITFFFFLSIFVNLFFGLSTYSFFFSNLYFLFFVSKPIYLKKSFYFSLQI